MLLIISLLLLFAAVAMFFGFSTPMATELLQRIQGKKADVAEKKLDMMFIQVSKNKLLLLYTFSPLILGVVAFILLNNVGVTIIAIALGFIVPSIVIKQMENQRKKKLQNQLVDGVMLLSSSLKGGLSLIQSIEVLVEEMPPPISQEFGLILRENKMGVTLDESLRRLNDRMKIDELAFLISSLLVARETGGDLTKVLSRLATTIRDNRKLQEKITTLTLQGKLQGMIMSVLPFLFVGWVMAFNKKHFEIMFSSETGRMLLILAVFLQIIGMFLIRKFSSVKI